MKKEWKKPRLGGIACSIFTSHMSHYDSSLCVSSILSLWLTLPNLWLPWELPHHWLILPHHTLQYNVTIYVYLSILSTLVVVYKSGILGTHSPRLDFTCNMVLVNWSSIRRNSIPHLFHSRHSSQRLCVLEVSLIIRSSRIALLQLLLKTQN